MRAVILFFALCAGFIICAEDSFQTLNVVVAISRDGIEILSTSMQDEDYIYLVTLAEPVKGYKFNKTQLATPGWNGGPVAKIDVTGSDNVACGLVDEGTGLVVLQGIQSTFFLSSANLSLVHTLIGPDRNSMTGFLSQDSDGVSVANFVSYATENPKVLQIRLDDPLTNDTSLFDLTSGLDYQASSYYNDIAILASFTSEFFVYNWTTKELLLTFKIDGPSTTFTAYDSERNVLYACGDRSNSNPPVLTRLDLSRIQNESTISFSLSSSSPYYESDTVIAQTIGPESSTCKDLVLHPSSGQLIYAVYDPFSSSGFVSRAIASTLDTIETKPVETAISPKPVKILIDNNKPLIYLATETEVEVIKLPTTFNCPLNCSSRGHCSSTTNYRCICDEPYFGHNCEGPIPEPPVEQPYYQPIKVRGRVGIPANIASVIDEDYLYYITNCSVSIGKISKLDILASTTTELSSNATTVIMTDFGVTIPVVDPQVGVIYLIGATNCNDWQPDHTSKLIRVSMADFTQNLVMDVSQIETAFLDYDRNSSSLNTFSKLTPLRYKSSKTDNPLQTLSPIPNVSSPLASVFLPQSNTGVVVTEYATVHYDFNVANITHRYFLPYGFRSLSLAADEERGKLYIVGNSWVDQAYYLIVLTPELIPYNAQLKVNDTSYAKWINLNREVYPSRFTRLFLDLEAGQAIFVQQHQISRINLLTHEVFYYVYVYNDYLSNFIQSAHYDADKSTLFVTTYNEAVALYIPPPCPRNCSGHGQCVYGACVCDDEFTGDLCDEVVPPVPADAPIEEPVSEPVTEPFTIPIANIASDAVSVVPMISLVAAFIVLVNLA